MKLHNQNHTYIMASRAVLSCEVSQGFSNKTWVIINKLKIITKRESEAMFPTTGTFIQQPKP